MLIEEALYAKLVATAGVTNLVATRIYPLQAPQTDLDDYVTYERPSGAPYGQHSGPSGLTWARMSYSCHSSRYANAKTAAKAIRDALDGFAGVVAGSTGSPTTIGHCIAEEDADIGFDPETRRYVCAIDFHVQYYE